MLILHPLICFAAVLPDFAQVYRFIGSVFDPDASNHLQKLKKMDLIDFETVCALLGFLALCHYSGKCFVFAFVVVCSYNKTDSKLRFHCLYCIFGYWRDWIQLIDKNCISCPCIYHSLSVRKPFFSPIFSCCYIQQLQMSISIFTF